MIRSPLYIQQVVTKSRYIANGLNASAATKELFSLSLSLPLSISLSLLRIVNQIPRLVTYTLYGWPRRRDFEDDRPKLFSANLNLLIG